MRRSDGRAPSVDGEGDEGEHPVLFRRARGAQQTVRDKNVGGWEKIEHRYHAALVTVQQVDAIRAALCGAFPKRTDSPIIEEP